MPDKKPSPASNVRALHPAPSSVHTLKVTLQEVEPPVWRRVTVASDTPLPALAALLRAAMGWSEEHVHVFDTGQVQYGPRESELEDVEDEAEATLASLAPAAGGRLLFEYDVLGDSWQHLLEVEHVGAPTAGDAVPRCLDGARACPPEDVGGAPGYEDLLAALRDPAHEEHEAALELLGEDFDPEAFDPRQADEAVRRTARSTTPPPG